MREEILVAGIIVNMVAFMPTAFGGERHRLRVASEARIQQSHGNLPAGSRDADGVKAKRGAPEGSSGSATATTGSPSVPVTCNQQNASSPACYSATQQARPVTR